ncbi:hypothetical protein [Mycobacterium sp. D16R24]|uniref:hypothetical protein n=1 Tax=Mycobacterium sp. D16R24 TaxID=1855656 RepID=UPI001117716C|nr:hypothetical protein [Mycobacterium sp. D16R24]
MSWEWVTPVAAGYGAVTATYAAIMSTLGRRDAKWRRAAKQLPEVRVAIVSLRDAVAEVEQKSRSLGSLRDNNLRAHLEVVQELQPRLSDKKLAILLTDIDHSYSALLALEADSADHKKLDKVRAAAANLRGAINRVSVIERKALP